MPKAIVVQVFTLDVERVDEITELAQRFGLALGRRGIDSILTVEEEELPDNPPPERKVSPTAN